MDSNWQRRAFGKWRRLTISVTPGGPTIGPPCDKGTENQKVLLWPKRPVGGKPVHSNIEFL